MGLGGIDGGAWQPGYSLSRHPPTPASPFSPFSPAKDLSYQVDLKVSLTSSAVSYHSKREEVEGALKRRVYLSTLLEWD